MENEEKNEKGLRAGLITKGSSSAQPDWVGRLCRATSGNHLTSDHEVQLPWKGQHSLWEETGVPGEQGCIFYDL